MRLNFYHEMSGSIKAWKEYMFYKIYIKCLEIPIYVYI